MGKMYSRLARRPSTNFNIENRAHKVIENITKGEKPKAAPKHASTEKFLDDFSKENPDLLKLQREKNEGLHARLQGMVVTPEKIGEITSRPLPINRQTVSDFEFGYQEPVRIPEGKCSIRQAIEFITHHQEEPAVNTVDKLANDHKISTEDMNKILDHFYMYQIQFPKDHVNDPTQKLDAAPAKKRKLLESN